ncbi:hypothetical protein UlMin_004221 [Ulmus minor]
MDQEMYTSMSCLTEASPTLEQGIALYKNKEKIESNFFFSFFRSIMPLLNSNLHIVADPKKRILKVDSITKHAKNWMRLDILVFNTYSKHDLKDKSQLIYLIWKYPEGIVVIDLKDSYPTVMEDLHTLKVARHIWLLSNFDSQEDIAYPNDPKVPIKVDDKNGMKLTTNTAKRRPQAQVQGISTKAKPKKKKHEISKRTKLTNAHLPLLFQNLK